MDIIIINSDKLSRSHDDLFLGVTVLGHSHYYLRQEG